MCYNKYCRLKKKESEIIFSNKINYCTKDIIKLFAVFIVALFTLFLIIFIKFEPVYEVKLGDETIGYVKSKEEIEKIINEELLKSEHECAVLSTLDVEPTYNLVLANKNLENQEEVVASLSNEVTTLYKVYSINVNGENKSYVNRYPNWSVKNKILDKLAILWVKREVLRFFKTMDYRPKGLIHEF